MIKTKTESTSLIIELPAILDGAFGDTFETESKEWLIRPVEQFVFDFKDTMTVKTSAYRPLLGFARMAKTGDKKVVSLNMRAEIAAQFKAEGVLGTFNPVAALETPAAVNRGPRLDVTMINPFVISVVHTLKVQASTEIHPGKPFVVRGSERKYAVPVALTGLIDVKTQSFTGLIGLAFPEAVIVSIYENMLGERCAGITPELKDATGELLNIIYGGAKTRLNELPGFELQSARPTVVAGERPTSPNETVLVLPFGSGVGDFHVEIVWLGAPLVAGTTKMGGKS